MRASTATEQTVGFQLQQARKQRRFSISRVSNATKIQPWVLEALEADRLQDMMSPIYVKGFLMTYAKYLLLDPTALLARLSWHPARQIQPMAEEPLIPAMPMRVMTLSRLSPSTYSIAVQQILPALPAPNTETMFVWRIGRTAFMARINRLIRSSLEAYSGLRILMATG